MNIRLSEQHELFVAGKAFLALENWTILKISGKCQDFLHNFCTAHIKGMEPGQALEAFILNEKGKTLGYGWANLIEESILFFSSPNQFGALHEQLNKYNILEEVQLLDASADYQLAFVHSCIEDVIGHAWSLEAGWSEISIGSMNPMAKSVNFCGRGYWLLGDGSTFYEDLTRTGYQQIESEAIEARRILSGVPIFDQDISIENLPQEVQRDKQAIHFEKGCYLGQETVARIDAMGHVNKLLTRFAVAGEGVSTLESNPLPLPGELLDGDKVVGRLTSLAYSSDRNEWVGLGVVRKSSVKNSLELADMKDVTVKQIEL